MGQWNIGPERQCGLMLHEFHEFTNSGDSLLYSSDQPHGGPVWSATRGRKGAWLSFLAILMNLRYEGGKFQNFKAIPP